MMMGDTDKIYLYWYNIPTIRQIYEDPKTTTKNAKVLAERANVKLESANSMFRVGDCSSVFPRPPNILLLEAQPREEGYFRWSRNNRERNRRHETYFLGRSIEGFQESNTTRSSGTRPCKSWSFTAFLGVRGLAPEKNRKMGVRGLAPDMQVGTRWLQNTVSVSRSASAKLNRPKM